MFMGNGSKTTVLQICVCGVYFLTQSGVFFLKGKKVAKLK